MTNFHLPKSTLLMLVSAFAGREYVLDAYQVAMVRGYRFYSFGDAMLHSLGVTLTCPTSLELLENEIIACRACPRLVAWREQVGEVKRRAFINETYWAKPVPGFGDPAARVLVVGLAPGAHGSNRTGRMFTGDASGDFLYPALYRAGFASQPGSILRKDELRLDRIYITAVCRCVPPDNKPFPGEIANCAGFLKCELELLPQIEGVVALGRIAFENIKKLLYIQEEGEKSPQFGHGVLVNGNGERPWLLGSYHPSQQNTQTGRLTVQMFDQIWEAVNRLLK